MEEEEEEEKLDSGFSPSTKRPMCIPCPSPHMLVGFVQSVFVECLKKTEIKKEKLCEVKMMLKIKIKK